MCAVMSVSRSSWWTWFLFICYAKLQVSLICHVAFAITYYIFWIMWYFSPFFFINHYVNLDYNEIPLHSTWERHCQNDRRQDLVRLWRSGTVHIAGGNVSNDSHDGSNMEVQMLRPSKEKWTETSSVQHQKSAQKHTTHSSRQRENRNKACRFLGLLLYLPLANPLANSFFDK